MDITYTSSGIHTSSQDCEQSNESEGEKVAQVLNAFRVSGRCVREQSSAKCLVYPRQETRRGRAEPAGAVQ